MFRNALLAAGIGLFSGCAGTADSDVAFDILISGGTVYDGSGTEGVLKDVGITGGRITRIGDLSGARAKRSVDATGKIVCPGFIDLHNHSDGPILEDGLRENRCFIAQGCTTVITGNCGGGRADVAGYFGNLEKEGAGTNVGHLLPLGTVRSMAMKGNFARPPTPEELDRMRAHVEKGMQEGALGVSTGLSPGFAMTDELVALARVVAKYGGIYASHIRSESDTLVEAVAEAIEIGRRAGCAVHISHFKACKPRNWGKVKEAAALIEANRAKGMKITCDQYPYTASSTGLQAYVLPGWALEGTRQDFLRRLDDPKTGSEIRQIIAQSMEAVGGAQSLLIASYGRDPSWNGKTIDDVARETHREPVDLVVGILRSGGATMVCFEMSDEDVEFVMRKEYVATASDGLSVRPGDTRPHPRSYGTFPRKIGLYALDRKVLSVAQAIRSSTGLPSDILKLQTRGYLRPGWFADVLVLDPATFRDRGTYTDPHQYATGVQWTCINGIPAVESGEPTGSLSGRTIRRANRTNLHQSP